MTNESIDWSKATEWAVRLLRNRNTDIPNAWANKDGSLARWVTDAPGCEFKLHEEAWSLIARRPAPQWSGEGLPPVGVVCEFAGTPNVPEGHQMCRWEDGDNIEIIAQKTIFGTPVVIAWNQGRTSASAVIADHLRPIRTPGQIEAEEREAAIAEMVASCPYPGSKSTRVDCEALYGLGYRKPKGGDV